MLSYFSSLHLQDAQQRFNCPLSWWKNNQTKYKMLSEVALRLLCIPATSAPSERGFSVAGLTMSKDQARLAPQTANELIFLHDALPAIRKYEESCHAWWAVWIRDRGICRLPAPSPIIGCTRNNNLFSPVM
jgi:hypothetical protein